MKEEKMPPNDTLDIMLDVETLGTNDAPVLLQLAARAFKIEEGPESLGEFDMLIRPQTCVQAGLKCDGETMDFWLKQGNDLIQDILVEAMKNGTELDLVLYEFNKYVENMKKKYNAKKVRVYGNGPSADCTWVRSAYKAVKMEAPWKYWDDVCVRTYVDIGIRAFNFNPKKDMPFTGNKHNALDDCQHQINYVVAIYNKIKEAKS